ncbi:MAG: amidase [Verrucomicrobiales bacterium]|nr:amidase [Verrucomicrobiales bacterium]
MKRRRFLGKLAAAGSVTALGVSSARAGAPGSEVATGIPATEQARQLASGHWTARSVAEVHLRRIEALNRRGPSLRAILLPNPDAPALADALDQERKSRGPRGPLHGVPIVVKDNIDTADRMPTTAGSLALAGTFAPRDAFLLHRLRDAGALLIAKANLSEWANIRSPRSSSGWSAVGGQTRNPYALDRSPSGSSSGSAVAVAAGFCAAAIGTETDGSIVSPASACSLVGLKPTVGLISRSGIIPISRTQDTAGPMTRTVADAALLLGVLAGTDPGDPETTESDAHRHADYTRFLDRDALRGARLGVIRGYFGAHPEVDALMERQLSRLRDLGAILVDPVTIPTLHRFGDAEFEVLLYELKDGLSRYLATRGDRVSVHSLADIIAFNKRHADRELRYFGQEAFLLAESRGPLTDSTYLDARSRCRQWARVEGLEAALSAHRLDALVAPTGGLPWLVDPINGDSVSGGCSPLAAVAGTPHLTVPAGYVRGLPVGLSFMGPAWSEPALLGFGHAFELATRERREPRFLATAQQEEA